MKARHNIDELLNSFVDGELQPRQQTEVQRLAGRDPEIAQRLRQLQQCKAMVRSLPTEQAPPQMLEQIKAALDRKTAPAQRRQWSQFGWGATGLFARRVVAAAAMIALVAVLGAVIYGILMPVRPGTGPGAGPVASEPSGLPGGTTAARTSVFSARLELVAGDFAPVDSYVNSAVAAYVPPDRVQTSQQGSEKVYRITCSRQGAVDLLGSLANIWPTRLESVAVRVYGRELGDSVVVQDATVDQTISVIREVDADQQLRLARAYATLNNVMEQMPGEEVLVAIDKMSGRVDPDPVPWGPVTGFQWPQPDAVRRAGQKTEVCLTIVLNPSR